MGDPNDPISLEARRSEPIPSLVECCEDLLAQAKSGELRSLVYLGFKRDGDFDSGNAGQRFNRAYVLGCFQQAGLDYYHRRKEDSRGEKMH